MSFEINTICPAEKDAKQTGMQIGIQFPGCNYVGCSTFRCSYDSFVVKLRVRMYNN